MRPLDETDREIIRLLLEDGRRPYSAIGEAVGLSGPAVSDRLDRLRERGVVRGFSVDLDRSVLREGPSVLAELSVRPTESERIANALRDLEAVDHVFRTVDADVLFAATVPDGDVAHFLDAEGLLADVTDLEVRLLAESRPTPGLGDAEFAPTCAECENTVDEEGESRTLGGETYFFCCGSCESNFVEQYERLSQDA